MRGKGGEMRKEGAFCVLLLLHMLLLLLQTHCLLQTHPHPPCFHRRTLGLRCVASATQTAK